MMNAYVFGNKTTPASVKLGEWIGYTGTPYRQYRAPSSLLTVAALLAVEEAAYYRWSQAAMCPPVLIP